MNRPSRKTAHAHTTVWRAPAADEGSAMFVVMAAVAILFVLSTMLVTISVYNVTSAQREEDRMRALHIADAGLNAYLAGMRHDGPTYASKFPILGPTATTDGTWTASITASQGAYIVRSVGTVKDSNGSSSRVLLARVAYPTYADYAIVADSDITIGSDAVFIGKVSSTGAIVNSGKVYSDSSRSSAGELWAGGSITTKAGSKPLLTDAVEKDKVHANQNVGGTKWIDFSLISGDMTTMQSTAASSGTSYTKLSETGVIGYQVVLSGGTYSLNKVYKGSVGDKYKGKLTYPAISGGQNLPIPSSGVLFFSDDVWVKGKYDAAITIASTGDIMLTQDIGPTNPASRFTCGLVAQSDVWIPTEYPLTELPDQITIQAALMAIDGECGIYNSNGPLRTKITFLGSRTYKLASGLVYVDGSGREFSGFSAREYGYDQRLDVYAPSKFPIIHNGELKVTTWQEQ